MAHQHYKLNPVVSHKEYSYSHTFFGFTSESLLFMIRFGEKNSIMLTSSSKSDRNKNQYIIVNSDQIINI